MAPAKIRAYSQLKFLLLSALYFIAQELSFAQDADLERSLELETEADEGSPEVVSTPKPDQKQ